ncbi:MAG: hypothetical protein SF182_23160 [Deltaproteobacteria bacterium]|nr:hypothetical protein [Deltaproteobacteria bacterium]
MHDTAQPLTVLAASGDARAHRMRARFRLAILAAWIAVLPVLLYDVWIVDPLHDALAMVLNVAIWLVFTAEVIACAAVSVDPWGWLRRHPIELAIALATPPILLATG